MTGSSTSRVSDPSLYLKVGSEGAAGGGGEMGAAFQLSLASSRVTSPKAVWWTHSYSGVEWKMQGAPVASANTSVTLFILQLL